MQFPPARYWGIAARLTCGPMSWYYYLENKLRFPFQAKCIDAKIVSPLKKGETAEVRRMAPEDACASDMLVLIRRQSRNLAVPLSQLAAIDADESTSEAIDDWHYWVTQVTVSESCLVRA